MLRHPISRFTFVFFCAFFGLSPSARALPITTQEGPSVPCAVVESFAGDVQVMDSTRTDLIVTRENAGVPCGGWISVDKGWVQLRHRDGQRIHLGSQTFAEFPENNSDGKHGGDHVILYKGEVYGIAGNGSGELKIATANGRARVKRGSVIVVFTHSDQETQLITLEDTATLENKFQVEGKVLVKSGEASSLNFRLLRVVPDSPKAVSVASLRPKISDLHISERDQSYAIEAVERRLDRSLASEVTPAKGAKTGKVQRKVASAETKGKKSLKYDYLRHRTDKQSTALRVYWAKKMAGGEAIGERILFPDKNYGRPQSVRLDVQEVTPKRKVHYQKGEESEKRKLIEELSQIKAD